MVVVSIVCFVLGLLILIHLIKSKAGENKAASALKEFEKDHNDISAKFVSAKGFLAFSDKKRKLYVYSLDDKSLLEIPYKKIVKYERGNEYQPPEVYFWAYTPKCTKITSGIVSVEDALKLTRVFDTLINNNSSKAEQEYAKLMDIPAGATIVALNDYKGSYQACRNATTLSRFNSFKVWRSEDKINLFPTFDSLEKFMDSKSYYSLVEININDIVDLVQEGNLNYVTEVSGGGGGGSSVSGAIVGGILAGEAGAIIGSRKPTDPIKSTTRKIDDRVTKLKISNGGAYGEISFSYDDYYALKNIIGDN